METRRFGLSSFFVLMSFFLISNISWAQDGFEFKVPELPQRHRKSEQSQAKITQYLGKRKRTPSEKNPIHTVADQLLSLGKNSARASAAVEKAKNRPSILGRKRKSSSDTVETKVSEVNAAKSSSNLGDKIRQVESSKPAAKEKVGTGGFSPEFEVALEAEMRADFQRRPPQSRVIRTYTIQNSMITGVSDREEQGKIPLTVPFVSQYSSLVDLTRPLVSMTPEHVATSNAIRYYQSQGKNPPSLLLSKQADLEDKRVNRAKTELENYKAAALLTDKEVSDDIEMLVNAVSPSSVSLSKRAQEPEFATTWETLKKRYRESRKYASFSELHGDAKKCPGSQESICCLPHSLLGTLQEITLASESAASTSK